MLPLLGSLKILEEQGVVAIAQLRSSSHVKNGFLFTLASVYLSDNDRRFCCNKYCNSFLLKKKLFYKNL
jgi:hypothetical protein